MSKGMPKGGLAGKPPFCLRTYPAANSLVFPSCSSSCFEIHVKTDDILKTENRETEGMKNMYN